LGKGNVVLGGVEMGEYRDTAEGGAGKVKGGAGEQGEECCGGGVCGSSKVRLRERATLELTESDKSRKLSRPL